MIALKWLNPIGNSRSNLHEIMKRAVAKTCKDLWGWLPVGDDAAAPIWSGKIVAFNFFLLCLTVHDLVYTLTISNNGYYDCIL